MTLKRTVLYCASVLILLISCSRNYYIIPEKDFENLILEMQLAMSYIEKNAEGNFPKHDTQNYYVSIIEKRGYTKDMFDSTTLYYSKNPKELNEMLESVKRKLARMETALIIEDSLYNVEMKRIRKHRLDSLRNIRIADSIYIYAKDSVFFFRNTTELKVINKRKREQQERNRERDRERRPAGATRPVNR